MIICLGPCCSGKTTYSLKYVREHPDTYRVSIDEMRYMCTGGLEGSDIDDKLLTLIYNLILNMQNQGKNIIIDGFPLNVIYLKLVIGAVVDVNIIQFEIDLQQAIIRNSVRRRLGGHYVKPTEMERFNKEVEKFYKSQDFIQLTLRSNVSTSSIFNSKITVPEQKTIKDAISY